MVCILLPIEPSHENLPKDPAYFSYKHHAAGFNYEIGLSLYESKLVWFNGPFKAGEFNDIKMFAEGGLKDKLQSTKKMVIADNGYTGYPTLVSTSNSQDSKEVSKFKVRARQRHEKYNGKLKEFQCLDDRFRHTGKLQLCFEAVNVISKLQWLLEEVVRRPLQDSWCYFYNGKDRMRGWALREAY